MKIFVTGGTGFIGSHFLIAALRANHEVIALRRSVQSRPRMALESPNLTWLTKPMTEAGTDDLRGVDALIHLAATGVSPQKATWDELMEWNVAVPTSLLVRARDAGVGRFVISGTFAEYGTAGERYDFIPVDAPLEPAFPYAASKAAFSLVCRTFAVENSLELSYQRIFSAYGDGQHEANFWPSLRTAAHSGNDFPMTPGEQIRDFVAVERVASRFCDLLSEPLAPGRPSFENLASGDPVSLLDFASGWWEAFGATGRLLPGAVPYRKAEVMRYVPLISSR